ncbi:olfactory receptor 14J1-like [Apodemus sylvaticus]|uniref:olfactory receptor 14J1-like n=1 Tax=Apodemus sylvaticus TaxID=10129 RepID=UPI002243F802|nr:olfactory receptor 14J1-like [Apodemus sylvaticus]
MTGFLLMGFSDNPELQILHALLFLVIHLFSSARNFIIITITILDTGRKWIQCMLQIFFFIGFAWSEISILTVMSYDRYVAICLPLPYEVIMSPRKCTWVVAAVWPSGSISGTLYTTGILSIRFCGNRIIHQFFCDVSQLLKLSCSNDYFVIMGVVNFVAVMAFALLGLSSPMSTYSPQFSGCPLLKAGLRSSLLACPIYLLSHCFFLQEPLHISTQPQTLQLL